MNILSRKVLLKTARKKARLLARRQGWPRSSYAVKEHRRVATLIDARGMKRPVYFTVYTGTVEPKTERGLYLQMKRGIDAELRRKV